MIRRADQTQKEAKKHPQGRKQEREKGENNSRNNMVASTG